MRFLGVIQGTNPKGYLIAKSTGARIKAGDEVFDKKKKPLGTIKRIFGPVETPYLSIKQKGRGSATAGGEVYTED